MRWQAGAEFGAQQVIDVRDGLSQRYNATERPALAIAGDGTVTLANPFFSLSTSYSN